MTFTDEEYATYMGLVNNELKKNPEAIKAIPLPTEKPLNEQYMNLYKAAININYNVLKYIKQADGEEITADYKELYELAISKKADALKYVPKPKNSENIDKAWIHLFNLSLQKNQFYLAVEHLPKPTSTNSLPRDYKMLLMKALKLYGGNLSVTSLPENGALMSQDYLEIYSEAVRTKGILQFVPKPKPDEPLSERYKKLYTLAVKYHPSAIQYIPKPPMDTKELDPFYKKLFLNSMRREGVAVQYLIEFNNGEPWNEDYKEIYLESVKENGDALEKFPRPVEGQPLSSFYKELFLTAVKTNGSALERIRDMIALPEAGNVLDPFYQELYLTAVRQDGASLRFIPKPQGENDFYKQLCMQAVKQNGNALPYVLQNMPLSEESTELSLFHKELCLAAVGQSLDALQYIPQQYEKDKQTITEKVLSKTHRILITEQRVEREDREVQKAAHVFTHSKGRQEKTTHLSAFNLSLLKSLNLSLLPDNVTVDFLGHATHDTLKMVGKTPEELVKIFENNPKFSRVVFRGCNSARAALLEEEKNLMQQMQKEMKNPLACSFMLMPKSFPDHTSERGIQEIKQIFKKQQLPKASYFLTQDKKTNAEPTYTLHYVEKAPTADLAVTSFALSNRQVQELAIALGTKGGDFTFQGYVSPLSKKLTPKQLIAISITTSDMQTRFDKSHPNYKEQKEKYFFLRGGEIPKNEEDKLHQSFMKKFIAALKSNSEIKHAIKVEGFTNTLYVDDRQMGFHVSERRIYNDERAGNPDRIVHPRRNVHVDEKALSKSRQESVSRMLNETAKHEFTFFKRVKYTVEKSPATKELQQDDTLKNTPN